MRGRPSLGGIQSLLGLESDPEAFASFRTSFNSYHRDPSHAAFFAMTLKHPDIEAEVHTFLAAGAGYQYWPASEQTDGHGDRLVYPADLERITKGVKYLASYGRLVHNPRKKRLATEAKASSTSKTQVRSGNDRKMPSTQPGETATREAKGDESDEESGDENPDFAGRRGVALAIAISKLGELSLRFKGDERKEIKAMKAEIDETITRIIDRLWELD
ncbi:MAG: hypothetical protein M1836_007946 [Candelina mexicana]|nr:MAG: hypothetical protein M1836_007946 [Candelina mexicana]